MTRRLRVRAAAFLAVSMAFAAGCAPDTVEGSSASPAPSALDEVVLGVWYLASGPSDGAGGVSGGELLTLEVGEGFVGGHAGCNRYMGEVISLEVGRIALGAIASTRMACAERGRVESEQRYLDALSRSTSYAVGADGSLILKGPGVSLKFHRGTGEAERE